MCINIRLLDKKSTIITAYLDWPYVSKFGILGMELAKQTSICANKVACAIFHGRYLGTYLGIFTTNLQIILQKVTCLTIN